MPSAPTNTREFQSLVEVVKALRGPDGCPWDKEQTHRTLTQFALEEAHEFAEAVEGGAKNEIVEELGDLLLQVVLHAEIGRQANEFTLADVVQSITEKMIRRHPHVFGDVKAENAAAVLENWNQLKNNEKSERIESPFASIPKALPALQRAQKIGAKTKKLNFDWDRPEPVFEKIEEELNELKEAYLNLNLSKDFKTGDGSKLPVAEDKKVKAEHEIGDLLFSVAQLARHLNIDPEQALRVCNNRFESRFLKVSKKTAEMGKKTTELPVSELEKIWQSIK